MSNVDLMQMDPEVIRDFLSKGNENEIHDFVSSYLANIRNALKSMMFRGYVFFNIRVAVVTFLDAIRAEQAEYREEIQHASDCHAYPRSVEYLSGE